MKQEDSIYIKEIALELLIGFIIALLIEICIVEFVRKNCIHIAI